MTHTPKRPSPREMAREAFTQVPWEYVNGQSFESVYTNGFLKGHEAARLKAEELVKALEEVDQMLNDGFIRCRLCDGEEMLANTDMRKLTQETLARYRGGAVQPDPKGGQS